MRIDERIELYLTEASTPVNRIKESAKQLKDSLMNDKKIKNKEAYITNISTAARYLVQQGIIRPAKAQDLKYVEKIVKETKLLFNSVNEASTPSKDEIAWVKSSEKDGYIVYGSKQQANQNQTKYALSPKKSLAKALFAANDEQGYTHYSISYGPDDKWSEIKRIPAKYLDADKYMD